MKEMLIGYDAENSKIYLRYPYDEQMNNFLFNNKFFAFWNPKLKQREISVKEEYVKDSIKNICKLIKEWNGEYKFLMTMDYRKFMKEKATEIKKEEALHDGRIIKSRGTDSNFIIPTPEGLKLLPFQKAGVEYIFSTDGKTLIADEMGLGKTIQAISYMNMEDRFPALVICPATLKLNWRNEIEKWSIKNPSVQILSSKEEFDTKADITVINYDILGKFFDKFILRKYKLIIADEVHYVKGYRSQRSKLVKKLSKNIPYRLGLTGTPLVNRPMEIWNIVNMIKPGLFNFRHFSNRYCLNGFIPDFRNGASNLDELQDKLRASVMIRRLKKDVLKELPDKRRILIPFDSGALKQNLGLLRETSKKIKLERKKGTKLEDLGHTELGLINEIERMKQEAVKAKLPMSIKFIENLIEEKDKVVLFAHHRNVIEQLLDKFGDVAVVIHGGVNLDARQEAVERFQTDVKIKLFIGSMQACSEGITLTASSDVVFLEFGWTPAVHQQAEDRCHRIGQKNSVTVYYLALEGSIDIYVAKLIQEKQIIIDQALDNTGKEVLKKTNVFNELMKVV
jgi:SWI/SNF-related matrix-associated actin-dependent regulator 1 of chromatin subfamily A